MGKSGKDAERETIYMAMWRKRCKRRRREGMEKEGRKRRAEKSESVQDRRKKCESCKGKERNGEN